MVLLITNGSNVVAQFPLTNEFLFEQKNPIKEIAKTIAFHGGIIRNDAGPDGNKSRICESE